MIAGFSTTFSKGKQKGKPTYFLEKIWKSIKDHEITIELADATFKHKFNWSVFGSCKPKKHTLRKDEKNRWKVGMMIDFFINIRTKNMFRFAPKLPVKSIQSVRIVYDDEVCEAFGNEPVIFIDGTPLFQGDYHVFAVNDGFDSIQHFCEWFSEDWNGKLIHWTDLKY